MFLTKKRTILPRPSSHSRMYWLSLDQTNPTVPHFLDT